MFSGVSNEGRGGLPSSIPPIVSRLDETSLRLADTLYNPPEITGHDPAREELIVGAAQAIEVALKDGLALHSEDPGSVPGEAVDETFRCQDESLALLTPAEQAVAWHQAAENILGPAQQTV
ncbi:MAG TPA: hypothetical protein VFC50_02410 [Candidatus Dormibacteraeota bacterium]|nr:hypothetical protein [Candidatus Dormibacteraeota bacterium]